MSISSRARVVGALSVTGVAVGLGFANAAAAAACENPPPQPPPGHDQTCDNDDVQFKAVDAPNSAWTDAKHFQLTVDTSQGTSIDVQLKSEAVSLPQSWNGSDHHKGKGSDGDDAEACTVSLAQYLTSAPDFKDTGLQQLFGKVATVHLTDKSGVQVLNLPALNTSKGSCDAQVDLYWGDEIFDGGDGPGHGPAPDGKAGVAPITAAGVMITGWNGAIAGTDCSTPPPPAGGGSTPPPPAGGGNQTPPPPATTPPATTPPPATPASTPKSTPTTPLTVTPPTTTLAETGSNAFPLVIAALTLFGAGTGTMVGSRKLARKS